MKLIKKIYRLFRIKLHMFGQLFKVKKIVNMESYYTELKRKTKIQRYIDNFKWVLKHNNLNNFYNLYGMDIKNKVNIDEYCDYNYFMETRNTYNKRQNKAFDYTVLLRDKFVFEKYMSSMNIKTGVSSAIIKNGEILDMNFDKKIDEKNFFSKKEFFIKSVDGECADGVYYIDSYEKYLKCKNKFKKGIFIVQNKIIQDNKMNILNKNSVNTIRIVTVNNGKNIEILSSVCRIGTKKSGNVDNWAAGGLCVVIDTDGKLTRYGFYKPGHGTKTSVHPDTNLKFENYQIPLYEEVKELVIKAHSLLYGIHSIGFDVAITKDGPVIIEANDNWEISLMQSMYGLKENWNKTLYKENKYEK